MRNLVLLSLLAAAVAVNSVELSYSKNAPGSGQFLGYSIGTVDGNVFTHGYEQTCDPIAQTCTDMTAFVPTPTSTYFVGAFPHMVYLGAVQAGTTTYIATCNSGGCTTQQTQPNAIMYELDARHELLVYTYNAGFNLFAASIWSCNATATPLCTQQTTKLLWDSSVSTVARAATDGRFAAFSSTRRGFGPTAPTTGNQIQIYDCANPASCPSVQTITTANYDIALGGSGLFAIATPTNTLLYQFNGKTFLPTFTIPAVAFNIHFEDNGMLYLLQASQTVSIYDCSAGTSCVLDTTITTASATNAQYVGVSVSESMTVFGCPNCAASGADYYWFHPAQITGDPHFVGFHGTKYNFDGVDNHIYAIFADAELHVNAVINEMYIGGINGTWITKLGIVAHDLNIAVSSDIGVLINGEVIDSSFEEGQEAEDGVSVTVHQDAQGQLKQADLHFGFATISIKAQRSGRHAYLNLQMSLSTAIHPHGILGQSVDPSFSTTPEGHDEDYEVSSLFDTEFTFTRYGKSQRARTALTEKLVGSV